MSRQELVQKLVVDKERLVELAREISFDVRRIGEAYDYAILEKEKTYSDGFDAHYGLNDAKATVLHAVNVLERNGADPKLIVAGQRLAELVEEVQSALSGYDYRHDIEFKGFKERWIEGTTIKKPVYKAILPKSLIPRIRKEINELQKVLGRKCGFSIPYKDNVTVSEALNDVSNCIHVYAEEIMNTKVGVLKEVPNTDGKVKADETADKDLVEIAVTWRKALEQGIISNLYVSTDVKETRSYIVDGRAYFRVGSIKGHATEIEKLDNELAVRYYDTDREVNEAVAEILEDKGDCECEKLDDGVKCRCKLTPRTKKAVAITMALATSMDIRMSEDDEDIMDQMKHYKEIEEYLNRPHVREEIEQVLHAWQK